jgi:hypothetical protein
VLRRLSWGNLELEYTLHVPTDASIHLDILIGFIGSSGSSAQLLNAESGQPSHLRYSRAQHSAHDGKPRALSNNRGFCEADFGNKNARISPALVASARFASAVMATLVGRAA